MGCKDVNHGFREIKTLKDADKVMRKLLLTWDRIEVQSIHEIIQIISRVTVVDSGVE